MYMDTQKVEQYAGVVRKVSTGLKVWNIIGIVGNALRYWDLYYYYCQILKQN